MRVRRIAALVVAVCAHGLTDLANHGGDAGGDAGGDNGGDASGTRVFKTRDEATTRPNRSCTNTHGDADCETWAAVGECGKNPSFMKRSCARACHTCGYVDKFCETRTAPPAKQEGGINAVFERAQHLSALGPTVRSRPPDGPWVITFDTFVSDEEAAAFLRTTDHHFSRSLAGDVVSPVRTSQQAWCQTGPCETDPLVNRVHERVVNVTGVPKTNGEFFQVLRYEKGQFYKTHHDQNTHPDSLSGARLFTFFIYLGEPEGGGYTRFPKLNFRPAIACHHHCRRRPPA